MDRRKSGEGCDSCGLSIGDTRGRGCTDSAGRRK